MTFGKVFFVGGLRGLGRLGERAAPAIVGQVRQVGQVRRVGQVRQKK